MKLFRNWLTLFILLGLARVASAGTLSAVVVNSTPYTIYQIYASSSDSSGWDMTNNLISGQSIPAGGQVTVNIGSTNSNSGDACDYDLMGVLYGTSQYAYEYTFNACNNGTWTITGS